VGGQCDHFPNTGSGAGKTPPAVYPLPRRPSWDNQFLESLFLVSRPARGEIWRRISRRGANDEIRDRGSAGNLLNPSVLRSQTCREAPPTTGNSLASFLLGEVNTQPVFKSRIRFLPGPPISRLYVQDDWARYRIVLRSMPAWRYEVEFPRYVVGNKMNSFDPAAINPVIGHSRPW